MKLLHFLGGKEHVLHLASSRDVADRDLAAATQAAVAILGNHAGRAPRRVCAEVLHRALFLHHWVNNHKHISGTETLEDLAERAKAFIQDVSLDVAGWSPANWLELAATLEYDDEALAQAAMPEILKLHMRLTSRGTAHLALVVEDIMRTAWLAGATLHRHPARAQAAAFKLLRHLDSTAPGKRTPFEKHWADSVEFLGSLQAFAHRAHTRHWVCLAKRNLRLPGMSALLRITSYLDAHTQEFPRHADLRVHLAQESEAVRQALAAADANEDIAPRYRGQVMFLERFNLRAADLGLLADDIVAPDALIELRADFE